MTDIWPHHYTSQIDRICDGAYIETMVTRTGRFARIDLKPPAKAYIFGDLHGDLESLDRGLDLANREDVLVFLGDYADRGSDGVGVIARIDELVDNRPERVVPLMGNHEWYTDDGRPTFQPCDLITEATRKCGSWPTYFGRFSEFVSKLSYAAIIPEIAFMVHGGLHPQLVHDDVISSPSESVFTEMMWGDPGSRSGLVPGMRGIGHEFGVDVTLAVTGAHDVLRVIRSHQPGRAKHGPAFDHSSRVVTISSTSVYGGTPHIVVVDPGSDHAPAGSSTIGGDDRIYVITL